MNPFKVGDRVRCTDTMSTWGPKRGEEFIVTCIDNDFIGFVCNYTKRDEEYYYEIREGKEAWWLHEFFQLVESVDDIPFNNQMKEIVK